MQSLNGEPPMPATVLFEHVKRQVGQRARIFHVRLREIVTCIGTDARSLLTQHRPINAASQHQSGVACCFSRRGAFLTAVLPLSVDERGSSAFTVGHCAVKRSL